MFRWGRAALIPLAVTGALLVACGDDEADNDATEEPTASAEATGTTDATATEEATATDTATATEEATPTEDAAAETVEVTAIDYGFEGLPETVAAGTKLTLTNSSETELHELVAFPLPAEETRSVEELLQLPEEELMTLFPGEPATVIIAMPATGPDENVLAVGDGTLTAPGRYAIVCFIPTGADPQAFAGAANSSSNEPPEVEGGPPHFVEGMYGELTVE